MCICVVFVRAPVVLNLHVSSYASSRSSVSNVEAWQADRVAPVSLSVSLSRSMHAVHAGPGTIRLHTAAVHAWHDPIAPLLSEGRT